MDRTQVRNRLAATGLDEAHAHALTTLLWNVHTTGEVREVDLARLSDTGFGHQEVCAMCELLLAALSRGRDMPMTEGPVVALLAALNRRQDD